MLHQKITVLFSILLFASFIINGCGKKEETNTTTDGDKKEVVKPGGEQEKVPDKTAANELGIKEGLPADYPAEVPQPKNSKCLGSLNTSEGTTVTFESDERPRDIQTDFSSQLEKNGYKKGEGEMMSEDGGMSMWNKDNKEVSIMLAWDKEKKKSSIVVTYKM
jgi:hypothetical protein